MLWTLLMSLATASTIYVDSHNPVLCKLDGALVRKEPATRIIIPELSDNAKYRVEITNLLGATIAFLDVDMNGRDEVYLDYHDGYLDEVRPDHEEMAVDHDGVRVLPYEEFRDLMRKLVKGSVKKKLKVLDARTQGWGITMRQTDEILASFHSRADRMAALERIATRISEPDKFHYLEHHFGVKSDRERMAQMFQTILDQKDQ